MGNIRTPKPVYFRNGVVEFYVNKKQIHYKLLLWLKDGFSQFPLWDGIYENELQINDLVKQALQSFSSVGVIEN